MAACFALSTASLVGLFIENKVNNAQSTQRDQDQLDQTNRLAALVECVDRAFEELSMGQPKVREASQLRNEALKNVVIGDDKHLGLGLLIYRAAAGQKSTNPKRDLASLVATFKAFDKADKHLLVVQKQNPFPDSPAKNCDLAGEAPAGVK